MPEAPTHWPWPADIAGIHHSKARWNEVREARLVGEVAAARAFYAALVEDGWSLSPTYGDHEPVEHAFEAWREGYVVMGLARLGSGDASLPTGSVNAWAPNGVALTPLPIVYPGFAAIQALARRCPECGAEDVDTFRVAFANRACVNCRPALRLKLEKPGWCD